MSGRDTQRAWKIHGLALAGFGALYLVLLGLVWTEPPRGLDLRSFVSLVLLMFLLGYALVSSLLMIWVGRRVWGPVVMHTLALVAMAVSMLIDRRDAERRQDELAAREAAALRERDSNASP